jgi:DNA-directed RNA polymerase beta subunit
MTLDGQLQEKTREYTGKDDILGITLMTFVQYISSTRSTMFAAHMKQYNVICNPEPPKVFTGYENDLGELSSALVKSDRDWEVIAKVEKFKDYPGHIYLLFIYDKEKNFYDVIQKKISEELTENFGYLYNNATLDSYKVGDIIEEGETMYKSTSYDEDNNYCYGLNARVGVMLAPGNIEDAYIVRKGYAEKMVSIKNDRINISINDNDFLLNIYGNSKVYKGFPDIGEEVQRRIPAVKRRMVNDQILFDMKKSNMMRIQPLNDKMYWTMGGKVVDIDIYSNKEISDIPDTEYNKQIIYYLKNQNRYCKEIMEVCEQIMESGADYSDDIGYFYSRASKILDPNWKWKDGETAFSNFQVELHVVRETPLTTGSKTTGRYGDKGVVSKILDDSEMPFDEDGRPLDVIVNPLSCINRLNPFQWIEMSINHASNEIVKRFPHMKSDAERWDTLKRFLNYFNERGEKDQLEEYYKALSAKDKKEFWQIVYDNGIYVNVPPMWQNQAAIVKLEKIIKEFDIHRDQLYIRKWGRTIPLMHKLIVGEKYMLKLKQTSEKGFSARSTGYLSQKGVPDKSNKVKTNEMLYSNTPIAIGRDEDNNLGIGVRPFILAKMHLFYRTSPFARKKIRDMYTNNPLKFKKFKIKRGFTNRNVEILNAKLKSLGLKIDFGFNGLRIRPVTDVLHKYTWKGKVYIRTREEMREILLDELLRKNFFHSKKREEGNPADEKKYQEFKRFEMHKHQKGWRTVKLNDEED